MSAHSSPSSNESDLYNNEPSTPARNILTELSPPNSRGPSSSTLPTLSNASNSPARCVDLDTSNSKNANGKRVLQASEENAGVASSGNGLYEAQSGAAAAGGAREPQPPGWAWQNKKAREEAARALEGIVQKDLMVGLRYGDPLLESDETSGA